MLITKLSWSVNWQPGFGSKPGRMPIMFWVALPLTLTSHLLPLFLGPTGMSAQLSNLNRSSCRLFLLLVQRSLNISNCNQLAGIYNQRLNLATVSLILQSPQSQSLSLSFSQSALFSSPSLTFRRSQFPIASCFSTLNLLKYQI